MDQQSHRKNEHVSLAEKFFNDQHDQFKAVRLIHRGLPEINFQDVTPQTSINDGQLKFKWPLYIEAMTGGSETAKKINARLSKIAQTTGLAMACGSESVALKAPQVSDSFQVIRKNITDQPVIANIGANHGYHDAQKAIDLIAADALEVHINVIQEMIMPEGDRDFHWLDNIQAIVEKVSVPVIVKEVGFGMEQSTIEKLRQIGVQNINISGKGGTSFAKIENFRRSNKELLELDEIGQTTVESLLEARSFEQKLSIIASGGVKSALDIVKCLALGANVVGVAGRILHSLIQDGDEATIQMIQDWQNEILTVMTILGCRNITELQAAPLIFSPALINYMQQRNLKY